MKKYKNAHIFPESGQNLKKDIPSQLTGIFLCAVSGVRKQQ
jgi:hypothetical protein